MHESAASTDDRRALARLDAASAHSRLVERKGAAGASALLAEFGFEALRDLPNAQLQSFTVLAFLEAEGAAHGFMDDTGRRVWAAGPLPLRQHRPEREAACRALLRLAVTHPDGERAVAAVLAAAPLIPPPSSRPRGAARQGIPLRAAGRRGPPHPSQAGGRWSWAGSCLYTRHPRQPPEDRSHSTQTPHPTPPPRGVQK